MKSWLSVIVAAAAMLCLPAIAHAKGLPIVYQTGEDIFVAGDGSLPAELGEAPALKGFQAGYRCDVFAVMWAYFSVTECKPVVFKGDTYADDKEISAAVLKAHSEDDIQLGFWGAYGKFPIGLLALGGLGVTVIGFFSKEEEEEPEPSASS